MVRVSDRQYTRLLEFRTALRRFLKWSELQARSVGLTPAQHQLLLAVKGHPGGRPTVTELADHLLLRHHSVVELLDRAAAAGLVARHGDPDDGRVVHAVLTQTGEDKLAQLTRLTLEEIRRLSPVLDALADSA